MSYISATGIAFVIIGFALCKSRYRNVHGVENKLFLGAPPPEIDRTLVNNFVKVQEWMSMILAGKTFTEIAESEGKSK